MGKLFSIALLVFVTACAPYKPDPVFNASPSASQPYEQLRVDTPLSNKPVSIEEKLNEQAISLEEQEKLRRRKQDLDRKY